jgi:hypothetical protein
MSDKSDSDSESTDSIENIQLKQIHQIPPVSRIRSVANAVSNIETAADRIGTVVFSPERQCNEVPRHLSELSLTRNNYVAESQTVCVKLKVEHWPHGITITVLLYLFGDNKYFIELITDGKRQEEYVFLFNYHIHLYLK